MWSRFKKRFFGGSRKMADDSSSLDETFVHACVLTDADDIRKSRQTLKQFAKDDMHAVPTDSTSADKKGGSSSGGKLKRKLSWFGPKSRRTTKSMTSLNSEKRRSGDDAVLTTKTMTSVAPGSANAVQTSTMQPPAAEPSVVTTSTASSATDKPSSSDVVSCDRPTGVVDSVVRITSSKTSSSLLNIDKSLLVSRDDVWCSRVEFMADKGTFGASCTSRIEELQRPVSLPVSATTAADAKLSPPKLKRRAKAASQTETETRKSRLSKNLPEPDPPSSSGEQSSSSHNAPPAVTTTTVTDTSVQVPVTSSVDAADTTEHLKSNVAHGASASGKRVPPPVPVRKYPPSAVSSATEPPSEAVSVKTVSATLAAAATVIEEGQVSPLPTRNSPDSGSDDTEGKESGYVTLDDLQAQLMRSSWSSDERDVTDSHSNTAHASSLNGIHFSCCMHYACNAPTFVGRGHYEMMGGVCLPVCLSVACLDLT